MHSSNPILLVEDDKVDAMTVKRALQELNISNDLVIVRDGLAALRYLNVSENSRPCLVLLDLDMPKMNGLEFLQAVKADEGLRKVPVIILTTSNTEQNKQDCFQLSAAGYFIKPFQYSEFVKLLGVVFAYWFQSETYISASQDALSAESSMSAHTCCMGA